MDPFSAPEDSSIQYPGSNRNDLKGNDEWKSKKAKAIAVDAAR
jgi:hypothetical protein